MTGDPPLLFSRSWRRNFKDPRRGQKHSLGPLIITTGVPLFGRGALFWVQNCSAGVPREAPFNFPAYLHLLLTASLLSGAPSCAHPLPLVRSLDRPTNIFFSLYRFPSIRPAFINIFRERPASETTPSRGIIETVLRARLCGRVD